jgi:RNA-directed DNA polymerase
MMHGRRKSDSAIVAVKPANNAERSAAEPVEPRAGTKGMRVSKARAGLRAA